MKGDSFMNENEIQKIALAVVSLLNTNHVENKSDEVCSEKKLN